MGTLRAKLRLVVSAAASVAVCATLLNSPVTSAAQRPISTASVADPATRSATPKSRASRAHASDCADVFFLGVAGSGEQRNGDTYGTTVAAVRKWLGGIGRVHAQAVKYDPVPAQPGPLADVLRYGANSDFMRGAARGVKRTQQALTARAAKCPREALVLSGYSQGAMVVVDALDQLQAKRQDITHRVGAVALVANPYAHPQDSSIPIGDAPASHRGIYRFAGRPTMLANREWGGRVFEVCVKGDIVCDTAGPSGFVRQYQSGGMTRHASYAKGSQSHPRAGAGIRRMATLIAKNLAQVPRKTSTTLSLTVGQPVTKQLRAAAPAAKFLRWAKRSGNLSRGLTLSTTGLLRGTPEVVGEVSSTYDVWNPSFAPRVKANVALRIVVHPAAPSTYMELTQGPDSACAVRADGAVSCFGRYGVDEARSGPWEDFAAGSRFCGIRPDRSLWCTNGYRNREWEISSDEWRTVEMSTFEGTCAVKVDNSGWCWDVVGDNTFKNPVHIPGDWKRITPGTFITCGIRTDGAGYCWGKAPIWPFGQGPDDQSQLVHADGGISGDSGWLDIDSKRQCGLTTAHTYRCWEGASDLNFGNPRSGPQFVRVSAGARHHCGLGFDNKLTCRGIDNDGSVGNGPGRDDGPSLLPGTWRDVSLGSRTSCGVQIDQTAWCWGLNDLGQVGNGTREQADSPVQLPGRWADVVRSDDSLAPTIGLMADGSLWCWGQFDPGPCAADTPQRVG